MGFEGASGFHPPASAGGGGTLTGANNGLHLLGTVVQLGGPLIIPTVVTATVANSFDLQDSFGSFLKTRNVRGNFSIADSGGNVYDGISFNIYSFLSTANSYIASNTVVNFGSLNVYTNAVDAWNFGDNATYLLTTQTFNAGRHNNFFNTVNVSVFGNTNTIGTSTDLTIIGYSNTISGFTDYVILGNNNNNVVVDAAGNFGIGTYVPAAKLHVVGVDVSGVNLRLEPIVGIKEDTTGATIPTTDATPNVTLQTIAIPNNSVLTIKTNVQAIKTAGVGVGTIFSGGSFERIAVYQNIGGVVTISGAVQTSFTGSAIAGLDSTLIISGTDVLVAVTGVAADDITWTCITRTY